MWNTKPNKVVETETEEEKKKKNFHRLRHQMSVQNRPPEVSKPS
jgi:hypothetical protein